MAGGGLLSYHIVIAKLVGCSVLLLFLDTVPHCQSSCFPLRSAEVNLCHLAAHQSLSNVEFTSCCTFFHFHWLPLLQHIGDCIITI